MKYQRMKVELSKQSYKDPEKNRNGDFCTFELLENGHLAVLALADGVGSSPCDWKASMVSCQKFIEAFKADTNEDITERFLQALKAANQEVLLTTDRCEGMKTTFCGVVWDIGKKKVHYTSIGDSRIYAFSDNKVSQISTDEVKSVILRKKDGKPMIVSGIAVTAEGITNVMGSQQVSFGIETKDTEGIDGMVLSTDGFHGLSTTFEEDIKEALNAISLEQGLMQVYQKYKDLQKDDMTILALRKVKEGNNYSEILATILNNGPIPEMNNFELSKVLLRGIEEGIQELNADKASKLIALCETKRIDLGREETGNLISLMFRVNFQNGGVYQKLMSLMRSSKA